jgi:hypothetical protein
MALFDDAAGRALTRVQPAGLPAFDENFCVGLEDLHARVPFEKLPRRYPAPLKRPRVKQL